eukprot:7050488-Pyramimonas_sp.AAC.1
MSIYMYAVVATQGWGGGQKHSEELASAERLGCETAWRTRQNVERRPGLTNDRALGTLGEAV